MLFCLAPIVVSIAPCFTELLSSCFFRSGLCAGAGYTGGDTTYIPSTKMDCAQLPCPFPMSLSSTTLRLLFVCLSVCCDLSPPLSCPAEPRLHCCWLSFITGPRKPCIVCLMAWRHSSGRNSSACRDINIHQCGSLCTSYPDACVCDAVFVCLLCTAWLSGGFVFFIFACHPQKPFYKTYTISIYYIVIEYSRPSYNYVEAKCENCNTFVCITLLYATEPDPESITGCVIIYVCRRCLVPIVLLLFL